MLRINPADCKNPEPCARSPLLFIGRNRRGNWVVRDQSGLLRGLFVTRREASRFALGENGRRPRAIVMVPGLLELDISGPKIDAANDSMTVSGADSVSALNGERAGVAGYIVLSPPWPALQPRSGA